MTTTTYLWDTESDNLLSEDDGTTTTSYTNEPGQFGDLVSQSNSLTANTNFYHFDARGDTRDLTDDAETVTDARLYDAWGNILSSSGATETLFQFIGKLGYTWDAHLEWNYARARWYRARDGHWVGPDSLLFVDGVNRFAYVHNSPVLRVDPSGLMTVPAGHHNGKICAVTMLNYDGKPNRNWEKEAQKAGDVVKSGIKSVQDLIDFIESEKCCSLYTIGHRGGPPNEGGTVSFPGGNKSKILPNPKLEAAMKAAMKNCGPCAINVVACGDINDPKGRSRRQEMANRTGCIVCGSVDVHEIGINQTLGEPFPNPNFPDETAQPWKHSCEVPVGGGGWTRKCLKWKKVRVRLPYPDNVIEGRTWDWSVRCVEFSKDYEPIKSVTR